jgi:hypothetical protein
MYFEEIGYAEPAFLLYREIAHYADCMGLEPPALPAEQIPTKQAGERDMERLKSWLRAERARLNPPLTEACRHSDDYRSARWLGTDYTFTATQAACVKVLWQNWEKGTAEVGEDTILEHPQVEAESKRLVDLFKGHPAWKTMIVRGATKGAYRLAEPR